MLSFPKFLALATLTLVALPLVVIGLLATGEPFTLTPWVKL